MNRAKRILALSMFSVDEFHTMSYIEEKIRRIFQKDISEIFKKDSIIEDVLPNGKYGEMFLEFNFGHPYTKLFYHIIYKRKVNLDYLYLENIPDTEYNFEGLHHNLAEKLKEDNNEISELSKIIKLNININILNKL